MRALPLDDAIEHMSFTMEMDVLVKYFYDFRTIPEVQQTLRIYHPGSEICITVVLRIESPLFTKILDLMTGILPY